MTQPRLSIRPYLTSSAAFNGTTSQITSGANTGITGQNAWSMSAVVFPASFPAYASIVQFGTIAANGGGTLYLNSGKAAIALNGVVFYTTINALPSVGEWYEIVATYAGGVSGALAIYVNGVNQTLTSSTSTYESVNSPMYIGSQSSDVFYFNGQIQDVRLWNVALSAATVSNMYYTGNIPYLGQSQLVRRYILNDGSGSTPKDSSVNGDTSTSTALAWSSNTWMKPRQYVTSAHPRIIIPKVRTRLSNGRQAA